MAKPRRTAMVTELLKRTRDYFEDDLHTPFDYAVAWTERGRTLTALALDVTKSVHGTDVLKPGQYEITRNMLTTYLKDIVGDDRADAAFVSARKEGAHGMVEEGVQTLDDSDEDRDVINANKARLEGRERLAAIWNADFRKSNGPQVLLTFAGMHLDALRQRHITVTATIAATAEGAEEIAAGNEE